MKGCLALLSINAFPCVLATSLPRSRWSCSPRCNETRRRKKLEVDADAVHQAEQVLYAFFAAITEWEKYTDQTDFDAPDVRPKLQQIWQQYVSEKPRMGYRPFALSLSPEGTYATFRLVDAEQVSRNKLYIYAQDERINLDYRFCMKRVGEAWKIDAVQMRQTGGGVVDCKKRNLNEIALGNDIFNFG